MKEKCVCVRRCVCVCVPVGAHEKRGWGGWLLSSYHKKAGSGRGPIMTAARARFHGDDAGMMLVAY